MKNGIRAAGLRSSIRRRVKSEMERGGALVLACWKVWDGRYATRYKRWNQWPSWFAVRMFVLDYRCEDGNKMKIGELILNGDLVAI